MKPFYLFILRILIVAPAITAFAIFALAPAHPHAEILVLFSATAATIAALTLLARLRRKAQQQIHRGEMLLAEAQHLARFGSWEWDIRANHVTWSDNLQRIYALPDNVTSATFESFIDFVHFKDRGRVKDEISRACKNRTTFEIYHRINAGNGDERILYVRGKPIINQVGQPITLMAAAQDVTEWKKAEESLGRAHAESEAKVQQRTAELTAVNDRLRQEIAQRRRAEQALNDRARQQSAAAQLGVQALQDGDLLHLIQEATSTVARTLEVDYCEMLDLQPENPIDRPSSAGWMDFVAALAQDEIHDSANEKGLKSRPQTLLAAASHDNQKVPPRPEATDVHSGLGILIESGTEAYGALCVYSRRPRVFAEDDVNFLTSIANIVATAIERNRANAARVRLAALLEATPDLVATARPNLHLCDLNPAGRRMLGIADEAPLNHHSVLDYHPTWARKLIINEGLPHAIREGVWSAETAVLGANGKEVPVYQVIVTQMNAAGDIEFIGTIIRDLSERKHLEREIISATEREQQRIGQDLHDDLCQFLTGVTFKAKRLEHRLADERPREAIIAMEIEGMLEQAIARARDLAHGLQPVIMEVGGLKSALEELAINTGRVFDVSCTFSEHVCTAVQDKVVATHLYRIAQEATRNAIVHGKARNILVRLESDNDRVSLTVEDDGVGMRPGSFNGKGLGLQIMNHRARIVGGTLTIQRREANGTRIICSVRNNIAAAPAAARTVGRANGTAKLLLARPAR
ncbi:MAG TPA: ATP-binding protein [Tepidisphaeraceae bacterium]